MRERVLERSVGRGFHVRATDTAKPPRQGVLGVFEEPEKGQWGRNGVREE